MDEGLAAERRRVGRCLDCRYRRTLRSKAGGAIILCTREGFEKYPRLPVARCAGFEARTGREEHAGDGGRAGSP